MKFCPGCGNEVRLQVPAGDNRERHVCETCGCIHYHNPRMIVGSIPVDGERILLCRRAIEPRYGFWTLPAGFLELGESSLEGALRETQEEAGAQIDNPVPYCLFDLPHIDQVYLFYRGDLRDGRFAAGTESLEVRLFSEDGIPWDRLAFPIIHRALQLFLADRRAGHFGFHAQDFRR